MDVRARFLLALVLATGLAGIPALQLAAADHDHVSPNKAKQLDALYDTFWQEYLVLNPLQATVQGDTRYLAPMPDFYGAEYRARKHAFNARWVKQLEDIGPAGLADQDLLSYEILLRELKRGLDAEQFPNWMQPVAQFGDFFTSAFVQFGSGTGAQPFKTTSDYDAWLARGSQLPVLIDSAIAEMRRGMQAGVVQPTVLMAKVLPQLDAIIKATPEETVFWGPIERMPADFPAADKARITLAYRDMIAKRLLPAYRTLRTFIADDYMPATRATFGRGALPDGRAWYAFDIRNMTTTQASADDIHAIGLSEVARIHADIRAVMVQVGFKGSLQDFFLYMRTDPRFTYKTEADLLKHFRDIEVVVNRNVATQFSSLPDATFEIRPVEPHRARSASRGQYIPASKDGTRPGIFYVNTFDLPSRRTWATEDLYLHEVIPGHFYQIELSQDAASLPEFRRVMRQTAYTEGWGLYAESLGKDVGLYKDPYSYFGRLQDELWRAIRLVVDTGLHDKAWSRDQAIRYMLDNSAASETDVVSEVERFMAIPGQALAYKIGELKIRELRTKAERELGAKFDVRRFHAEVLKDGSVPLDVLERKIDRWIASEKG